MQYQEDAVIIANRRLKGDYFQVDLRSPQISSEVEPGQFVHVKLPEFEHRVLRRPFSVFTADPQTDLLSIIYKVVGEGTTHLASLPAGQVLNLLGPLGVGFSLPQGDVQPIIVAGGYGCAATYLLAKRNPMPFLCLIGGRSAQDLLLVDEFRTLGCTVEVSTDDGSAGHHGLVTDLLDKALENAGERAAVYACGPNPMLKAVGKTALARNLDAEISLDHAMCCGIGACFACVVKMKADNPDGWEYVRTCMKGPVFKASDVYWED